MFAFKCFEIKKIIANDIWWSEVGAGWKLGLHHPPTWSEVGARLVFERWGRAVLRLHPNFWPGFGRKMGQTGLKTEQVGRWGTTYIYICCVNPQLHYHNEGKWAGKGYKKRGRLVHLQIKTGLKLWKELKKTSTFDDDMFRPSILPHFNGCSWNVFEWYWLSCGP